MKGLKINYHRFLHSLIPSPKQWVISWSLQSAIFILSKDPVLNFLKLILYTSPITAFRVRCTSVGSWEAVAGFLFAKITTVGWWSNFQQHKKANKNTSWQLVAEWTTKNTRNSQKKHQQFGKTFGSLTKWIGIFVGALGDSTISFAKSWYNSHSFRWPAMVGWRLQSILWHSPTNRFIRMRKTRWYVAYNSKTLCRVTSIQLTWLRLIWVQLPLQCAISSWGNTTAPKRFFFLRVQSLQSEPFPFPMITPW